MKIEHVAFQVKDAPAMAKWYAEHLGFTIKREDNQSPYVHFLADDSGTVMIEIYSNPDVPLPDYTAQNPFALHLALVVSDSAAEIARLTAAGATQERETTIAPNGDELTFMRDPWGFVLQLAKRTTPMI